MSRPGGPDRARRRPSDPHHLVHRDRGRLLPRRRRPARPRLRRPGRRPRGSESRPPQPDPTIYGALAAILRARKAAGAGPVTLLNCDNLRHNGERFRAACWSSSSAPATPRCSPGCARTPPAPTRWSTASRRGPRPSCASACTPPPASTTPRADGRELHPVGDRGRLHRRPAGLGARRRADGRFGAAYEEAKIRLLNATHSCIAWAGTLSGCSSSTKARTTRRSGRWRSTT